MTPTEMENRLVQFSIDTINLARTFRNDDAGKILSRQIIRSSSSVSLNYAEASESESRRDFIHKMKIALKELNETHLCYQIISGTSTCGNVDQLNKIMSECRQLIAIFISSIKTARNNLEAEMD